MIQISVSISFFSEEEEREGKRGMEERGRRCVQTGRVVPDVDMVLSADADMVFSVDMVISLAGIEMGIRR